MIVYDSLKTNILRYWDVVVNDGLSDTRNLVRSITKSGKVTKDQSELKKSEIIEPV